MTESNIKVGDKIQMVEVPPDVELLLPAETQELYRRCIGQVLRVERFNDYGELEVLVCEDGSQAPDHSHHTISIDPDYAKLVS